MKKITTKEYKEQIKNRNVEVLEEYKGIQIKILHQCSKGHKWMAQPHNIKKGHGCPECFNKKLTLSTQKYKEQIKDTGFRILEEYKGAKIKILHQCAKGHQWMAVPRSIKNGTGCPYCQSQKTAFDRYKNKPTWLYYIFIPSKNIYKIGVSMNRQGGTKGRYKNESFEIEIIQEELFEDGYEAWKLEQEIIQANKHLAWCPSKEEKFGGWTECFTENVIKI